MKLILPNDLRAAPILAEEIHCLSASKLERFALYAFG